MSNLTDTTLGSVENIAIHYKSTLMEEMSEDVMDMQPFSEDFSGEFPNGDSLKYAEVGDAGELTDVDEYNGVPSTGFELATGLFVLNKFKGIAHEFTRKQIEDGFWTERKLQNLRVKHVKAARIELLTSFLNLQSSQTAASLNSYNGLPHRWIAQGGTGASDRKLNIDDIARVRTSFVKADRDGPIIGLIDPVQADHISRDVIIDDQLANDPMWSGMIRDGMVGLGAKYMGSIFGVQLFQTNRLPTGLAAETINSVAANAGGTANIFFTPGANATPFAHAWRRKWDVREGEVANTDGERRKVSLSGRWGTKLLRPSGLVTVISNSTYA